MAYSIAVLRTSMGQTDQGFVQLSALLQQGYAQPDQLASNQNLQPLRSDPRFAVLVNQAKRNRAPCEFTPEYRQFDFWLGDWVASPSARGQHLGQPAHRRAPAILTRPSATA